MADGKKKNPFWDWVSDSRRIMMEFQGMQLIKSKDGEYLQVEKKKERWEYGFSIPK